ncbi:pinin [Diabrotica virgifera virgifera]|uniref:Pinin n=2 Tax=Diabrotica virgifera virgifera TaxID=50390 RepID=A0ABM5JMZ1_DIAVI|nr:pinin [Diabrotica virgifera virgifera]
MGTEIISFGNLQHELEEAKNSLKGVDESIKRLIGRDPSQLPPRNVMKRLGDDKSRGNNKTPIKTRMFTENEEPPAKRRSAVSVFNRLSDKVPDDDDVSTNKRGLISKVIVTPKKVPSREQALEAQNKDEKFKARNRRMFGALLGTLQKFQQEETKLKQREQKRAEVEKKIEEHEIKEKEEVRKERQELFLNRKKKQAEIKLIEMKMLRTKEYTVWEQNQKPSMNFIKTKAKPPIYYLPRKMSERTKKILEDSSKSVEEIIENKKKQVAEELEQMEIKMRKGFDKLGGKKEEKEDSQTEQDQEHEMEDHEIQPEQDPPEEHQDSDHNGHIDDVPVSKSPAIDKEESDGQVETEVASTELSNIALPDENHRAPENAHTEENGNYSFISVVPDQQTSFQSGYYQPGIGQNDNFQPEGGE